MKAKPVTGGLAEVRYEMRATRWIRAVFSVNPTSLTIGSVSLVLALYLSGVPILDLVELRTYDLRFRSLAPREPSPALVLALIDEKSLDLEGRWPWRRSRIAALVDALSRDGARVIGFDVGFLEPEEASSIELIEEFARTLDSLAIERAELDDFIDESRRDANSDLLLASAIQRSSASVVLGYFFHMDPDELGYQIESTEIERQLERIRDSSYPIVMRARSDVQISFVPQAYAAEGNIPILAEAADASGYFSLTPDQDGVVRWMPLAIGAGEELYPPLGVLMAWRYLGSPKLVVRLGAYGVDEVQMGDRSIPTDESGKLLLNYLGPPMTFPHVSVGDILSGATPAGTFDDKIVLVGATATGTYDMRTTPLSSVYPGVEIHATAIENILTGSFMTRPNWSKVYDLFAIVVLGCLAGIILPRLSAFAGLLLFVALFVAHVAVAYQLFTSYGAWLNIVYPLLALAFNYIALTVYSYVTEERERKKIKGAFEHYVAPEVIEGMLQDPSRLKLGGEQKVLTVLFSDLQGFTSFAERFGPQQTFSLLSEYYARMTEQVFAQQGTLKEYVGDELMAIFGAPMDQADHAQRACSAALGMREFRHAMSEEWVAIGRPPLIARTGVNSGPMLVGNLGSEYRFSYGVLGDDVNLGSRLEGMNKLYRTEILIGEHTAELVDGLFALREIDLVRVVGKQQPVRIYELLAHSGTPLPAEQQKALGSYAAALTAYREKRWDDAAGLFGESLDQWPQDGPSRTMSERVETLRVTPPPEEWDGVFVATEK